MSEVALYMRRIARAEGWEQAYASRAGHPHSISGTRDGHGFETTLLSFTVTEVDREELL
jgi:hypothetical protein